MSRRHKFFSSLTIVITVFLMGCDISQTVPSPDKEYFLKYYGMEGFQTGTDLAYNPADGSFVMFGTTGKFVNDPADSLYLVKADRLGNTIWTKAFGGQYGNEARDVEITSAGDIIVLANEYKDASRLFRQICVARFSQSGAIIDQKIFTPDDANGNASTNDGDAASITELTDGGFIIAGSATDLTTNPGNSDHLRDGIHVRLNKDLTPYMPGIWKNVLGGSNNGIATRVIQISDYLFFRFGYSTDANSNFDFKIIGINRFGDTNSGEVTSGLSNLDERLGSAVIATTSGAGTSYVMAGVSTSTNDNSSDLYMASLSQSVSVNNDTIPGFPTSKYLGFSLKVVSPADPQVKIINSGKSGFLILANEATTGNSNWVLTKVDNNFGIIWPTAPVYGGSGDDFSGALVELPDGKIVMLGTMSLSGETKMTLIKVNKDGQFAQ